MAAYLPEVARQHIRGIPDMAVGGGKMSQAVRRIEPD